MIRYGLRCGAGHAFDGWFRSFSDFETQSKRGLLSCPACGGAEVSKALMAPALGGGSKAGGDEPGPEAANMALVGDKDRRLRAALQEFRRGLTENSEDVGDRFPEVARQMHADEIERRTVHGRASPDEAKALVEEGVPVQPLPQFPDEMN